MKKPDWKDAPDWARYAAMGADGYWFWYENKPSFIGAQWWPKHGRCQLVNAYDPNNAKCSLTEKPQ